jgi:hypothetical protein
VIAIEQGDRGTFNRGKLINAGFDIAHRHSEHSVKTRGAVDEGIDYVCIHDPDLRPAGDMLGAYYKFRGRGTVVHPAVAIECGPRPPNVVGGVVCLGVDAYRRANGMYNGFWGGQRGDGGGGGEENMQDNGSRNGRVVDDQFHERLVAAGITVEEPAGVMTAAQAAASLAKGGGGDTPSLQGESDATSGLRGGGRVDRPTSWGVWGAPQQRLAYQCHNGGLTKEDDGEQLAGSAHHRPPLSRASSTWAVAQGSSLGVDDLRRISRLRRRNVFEDGLGSLR